MKKTAPAFWIVVLTPTGILLAVVLALVYYTKPEPLSPGETLQVITLLLVLLVTFWYAHSTDRINRATSEQVDATRDQVETSQRALQHAFDAEKNAVLPVVKFQEFGRSGTGIRIRCSNVGKGPALNLRLWIEFQIPGDPESMPSARKLLTVLGEGETEDWFWSEAFDGILPLSPESHCELVAEYTDIYQRSIKSRSLYSGYSFGKASWSRSNFSFCIEPEDKTDYK